MTRGGWCVVDGSLAGPSVVLALAIFFAAFAPYSLAHGNVALALLALVGLAGVALYLRNLRRPVVREDARAERLRFLLSRGRHRTADEDLELERLLAELHGYRGPEAGRYR